MLNEDVLQYLKDNLLIVPQAGGYIVTNKLKRALSGVKSTISNTKPTKFSSPRALTIDELYKQFIVDAEVPTKITTSSNFSYWANRYSKDGAKAFKAVYLDTKIDKKILLAATKWYYKQTNTARVMISKYFTEGIWESCYDDFVRAIEKNKSSIIPSSVVDTERDKGRNSLRL